MFLLPCFISNLRRLAKVEIGLVHGSPEIGAILKALAMRILGVIFAALLHWARLIQHSFHTSVAKAIVFTANELLQS